MIKIFEHPIITIKLTKMRDKNASHKIFRKNLEEITSLMVYEILRDYNGQKIKVETPTKTITSGLKYKDDIVIVPILRAGLGMTRGIENLIPEAKYGHIGLYRDEKDFSIKEYFFKMPNVDKNSQIILVDPMLATGFSSKKALDLIKSKGFNKIKLVCLVGSPEGVELIEKNHPDVNLYLAALDEKLNEKKYIIPGLGDAGDRIFGTK